MGEGAGLLWPLLAASHAPPPDELSVADPLDEVQFWENGTV